jgi:hypothetical protein
MPRFQHTQPDGHLQFWVADEEVVVTSDPKEFTDPQVVRWLEACPFVKRAASKPAKGEEE